MIPKNNDAQIAKLATDPLRFIKLCWPEMNLYDKQLEVLTSVNENVETFVHAANQTGKTHIAAIVALWFYASRTPARVVISSSSESQLRHILWSEILQLIQSAAVTFPFLTRDLCIQKLRRPDGKEILPKDYLLGHVTHTVESFQGHHLNADRPRVLSIFDEASGVPDEFYEAAQSWAHRILVIGNPISTDNFFYFRSKEANQANPAGQDGLFRKVIRIDGLDVPNVKMGIRCSEEGRPGEPPVLIPGLLTYQNFVRHQAHWNEVMRTTRLHGQFYEGKYQFLFPNLVLDRAMDRQRWEDLCQQDRQAEAMGVDVAAGGRDHTCWTIIDRFGVIEQIVRDMKNSMEIVGFTIELLQQYKLEANRAAFDAGGGGKQIADRLHEQGLYVQTIYFGQGANDKQAYLNRRTEMYGILAELFDLDREEGVFALPPDAQQLRAELNILPRKYDSEGRLVLPPKEAGRSGPQQEKSIRQLLGRSPDRADSLVLAVSAFDIWKHFQDSSKHVYWDEADCIPLSPDEYDQMEPWLREIHEAQDEIDREWAQWRRGRDDDWL